MLPDRPGRRGQSRRRLLGALGALGAAATGGCLSWRSSEARIAEIVLGNLDDASHAVAVAIATEEGTVFRAEREVVGADDSPPERQPVLTHEDGVPTGPAKYTIRARLDGGVDEIERTYPDDARGGDGDCYSVTVLIDLSGDSFRSMPSDSTSDRCP